MTANRSGNSERVRIPIIWVTVFGIGALLVLAIGATLYLGFSQAAQSTRQLWAEQSETLVHAMEDNLARHLSPIPEQAR